MTWLCTRHALTGIFGTTRLAGPSSTRFPTLLLRSNTIISRRFQSSPHSHKAVATPQYAARIRSQSEPPSVTTEPESSVARGTRYELLCCSVLSSIFGMDLERTGGSGDRGIDLRGWWTPQQASSRIRILAQCKCQDEGGKKMGPILIREMEGVVFRACAPSPEPEEDTPVAGIVLSSSGFSKQALLQVRSSSVPLAAMHVLALPQGEVEVEGKEAELVERCVSIVWSDKFGGSQNGLLEGGMEARWVRTASPRGSMLGRPVIYRGGKPL